jgi:hypothetical protein
MAEQQRPPELIPIWCDQLCARWMVSVESDRDPTGEDYWSGWFDVDGDARSGLVEIAATELTPAEARNLAQALLAAADHAESYVQRRCEEIHRLTEMGSWPELDALPIETQVAVRDALRAAARREREAHEKRMTARRAPGEET